MRDCYIGVLSDTFTAFDLAPTGHIQPRPQSRPEAITRHRKTPRFSGRCCGCDLFTSVLQSPTNVYREFRSYPWHRGEDHFQMGELSELIARHAMGKDGSLVTEGLIY